MGGVVRVGEFLQVGGDAFLQLVLEGGIGPQVETVEVVQWHAEHPGQAGASQGHALVGRQRLHRRLAAWVAERQLLRQRRIA